ncbi:hypothetical protein GCM10022286_24870 [Gryllotalpicola daejeonensis]|uniref:HTH cro/C1-type domain-containing protein n=1 Tax=Gryllotalpicola daejeonensis TaxID=993087 RepID=A0ABP7ZM35_9MICO
MAELSSGRSIGGRIKRIRRQRGFASAKALADACPGGNITEAVLTNIESGRRSDLQVSQLLNIARALDVPPSMLLAPTTEPKSELDLPNLSADFDGMTAAEFDCWFSGTPASWYRPRRAAERIDIELQNTLRELGTLERESERLRIVLDVQASSGDADLASANNEVRARADRIAAEAARVAKLLTEAGVVGLEPPTPTHLGNG